MKAASWRSHRGRSGQSSCVAHLFSPHPAGLRLDGSNAVICLGRPERIRAFSTVVRRHLAAQYSFPPSNSDPVEFVIQQLDLRRDLVIRVLRERGILSEKYRAATTQEFNKIAREGIQAPGPSQSLAMCCPTLGSAGVCF